MHIGLIKNSDRNERRDLDILEHNRLHRTSQKFDEVATRLELRVAVPMTTGKWPSLAIQVSRCSFK